MTHWHQGRVEVARAVQDLAALQARDFVSFEQAVLTRPGCSYLAWHLEGLREAHDACGEGAKRERFSDRLRFIGSQLIGRHAS